MVNVNTDWISKPTGITKCLTLVLNIVCIGLLAEYGIPADKLSKIILLVMTTGGFLLVDLILLIGYVVDSTHGKAALQEMVAAAGALVLELTSGAIAIDIVKNRSGETADALKAYGALCIINCVVYGVHAFFCFKNK